MAERQIEFVQGNACVIRGDDIDTDRIARLNRGDSPIYEEGIGLPVVL